jgi:hypothetical protein
LTFQLHIVLLLFVDSVSKRHSLWAPNTIPFRHISQCALPLYGAGDIPLNVVGVIWLRRPANERFRFSAVKERNRPTSSPSAVRLVLSPLGTSPSPEGYDGCTLIFSTCWVSRIPPVASGIRQATHVGFHRGGLLRHSPSRRMKKPLWRTGERLRFCNRTGLSPMLSESPKRLWLSRMVRGPEGHHQSMKVSGTARGRLWDRLRTL